jgi:hypothetical protein
LVGTKFASRFISWIIIGLIYQVLLIPFIGSAVIFFLPLWALSFVVTQLLTENKVSKNSKILLLDDLTISRSNFYSFFNKLAVVITIAIGQYFLFPGSEISVGFGGCIFIIANSGITKMNDPEDLVSLSIRFQLGICLGFWIGNIIGTKDGQIAGNYVAQALMIIIALYIELRHELKDRSMPNKGIWNSLKIQAYLTTIIFIFVIAIFTIFNFSNIGI